MEKIDEVIWTQQYEDDFKKIRDRSTQDKLEKQINKIIHNPAFGKPLKYDLNGERTIYIKPYRLVYSIEGTKLILLRFEHRKEVYR